MGGSFGGSLGTLSNTFSTGSVDAAERVRERGQAHTVMRQHGAHLEAAPAAAGSAAGGLQRAAVDYYFNQLTRMAEQGLQEQGLH